MQSSEQQVHITWHNELPTPAQLALWYWLWARLLGHVASGPQTRQPQDHEGPRAETVATATNGHNLSELDNDNKDRAIST